MNIPINRVTGLEGYQMELSNRPAGVSEESFKKEYELKFQMLDSEITALLWEKDIKKGIQRIITTEASEYISGVREIEEKHYVLGINKYPSTTMKTVITLMLRGDEDAYTDLFQNFYQNILLEDTLLVSTEYSNHLITDIGVYLTRLSSYTDYTDLVTGLLEMVEETYSNKVSIYEYMVSYVERRKLDFREEDYVKVWNTLNQMGIRTVTSQINNVIKKHVREQRRERNQSEEIIRPTGATKFSSGISLNEQLMREHNKYKKAYEERMYRMYQAINARDARNAQAHTKPVITILKNTMTSVPTVGVQFTRGGKKESYILSPYSIYSVTEDKFVLSHQSTHTMETYDYVLGKLIGNKELLVDIQSVTDYRKLNKRM